MNDKEKLTELFDEFEDAILERIAAAKFPVTGDSIDEYAKCRDKVLECRLKIMQLFKR